MVLVGSGQNVGTLESLAGEAKDVVNQENTGCSGFRASDIY